MSLMCNKTSDIAGDWSHMTVLLGLLRREFSRKPRTAAFSVYRPRIRVRVGIRSGLGVGWIGRS